MVKDVPAYPAPPEPAPVPEHESVPAPARWSTNMTPAEVAAKIRADRAAAGVGTDAFVRPSGPESPGRSAVATTTHVGTGTPARPSGPVSPGRSALPSSADTSRPKPPASVREDVKAPAAPKERKTAAHSQP
jgi:hypothetical protein